MTGVLNLLDLKEPMRIKRHVVRDNDKHAQHCKGFPVLSKLDEHE